MKPALAVPQQSRVLTRQILLILPWLALAPDSWGNGQTVPPTPPSAPMNATAVRPGERLSDWLLRQGLPAGGSFPAGLVWQSANEKPDQADWKRELLLWLRGGLSGRGDQAAPAFADWIQHLPVTGRVPLPSADARLLQARIQEDPVLAAGDEISTMAAPGTVAVLRDDARICLLPFVAGQQAGAYVAACYGQNADQVDVAWVVQADGHVQRARLAEWNASPQDPPTPGAVIWSPRREVGWPLLLSERLARFLATQAPGSAVLVAGLAMAPAEAPYVPAAFKLSSQLSLAPRDFHFSGNDWGTTGLLQTPTARMMPEGSYRVTLSHVYPYGRANIMLQPFEWLEAGFRYTNIQNELYGPTALSGTQAYKDKSVDAKLKLSRESATSPEVALGFVDLAGTGLFSSEYLVASKRKGDWDASLGLAWGYLGNRAELRNPLAAASSAFATRPTGASAGGTTGGQLATGAFFHGPASIIGGLQYQPAWLPNWQFKAELDGNNYHGEPFPGVKPATSPLNLGVVYNASNNADLSVGFERGNQLMVSLQLYDQLSQAHIPKVLDTPPPEVLPESPADAAAAASREAWAQIAQLLLEQTGWPVKSIALGGNTLQVVFDPPIGALYARERVDRALAVLHRYAPAGALRFVLTFTEYGLPQTELVVRRADWVTDHISRLPPSAHRAATDVHPRPVGGDVGGADTAVYSRPSYSLNGGIAPMFHPNIGGPDGFLIYAAGVSASFDAQLGEGTFALGNVDGRILDNYSLFKFDAPSLLPHVRTNFRQFLTTSRVTLTNLQVNHVEALSDDSFAMAYGGVLEFMYAGVGGEYLYRPWNSHFALGVDVNRVQQRGYDQRFDLQSYKTTVGNLTLYWDTGWEHVKSTVSYGRYLAGDVGATFTFNRTFDNGATMGIFFTKTNVSAAQYGEGSFDKGIFLNLPFDAVLPKSSSNLMSFVWDPLVRDGGARLNRGVSLYSLTDGRDERFFDYHAAGRNRWDLGDDADLDALASSGQVHPITSLAADVGHTGVRLAGQFWNQPASTWLTAAGLIGGSALLDKPLASFAAKHQTAIYNRLGSDATAMPYFLAVGAGLAATGTGDSLLDQTGWTALKSALLDYGLNLGAKLAVDRARPVAGTGTYQFGGPLGKGAANSSFMSEHVGVAFALVTPFAQIYNAPALYALAGATAFGRIQQQQHFLSDTVAGGLFGYMVGGLTLSQQRDARPGEGVRLSIGTDRTIRAYWELP